MPISRLPFSQLLGTIALAPTVFGLAAIGLAVAMASAQPAAAAPDPAETTTIVLHRAATPTSPEAERKLRRRIESAALSVCGGGGGSLAEVDRTVRDSPCWHDAVTRANAQIAR